MKKIEAIIHPYKLDEVHEALQEAGFSGLTVTEVKGHGKEAGQIGSYRGTEYTMEFIPKLKIELVCPDNKVYNAIAIVISSAKTGHVGDGKIFINTVEEAIRVRTEETGDIAL
ncbi:MAG TPA: P-II family nitrogen regulator [Ignavibacteriaceae bacterium]|nr:P-II family nitrogen regulator [Ignavibacteriaceae bacterium]